MEPKKNAKNLQRDKLSEIIAVIFITAGIYIFLSLITFNPQDLPFYASPPNSPVKNLGGFVGAYIGGFLLFLIGISAYAIPILFIIWGINSFLRFKGQRVYTRTAGTVILIMATSTLASLIIDGGNVPEFRSGGTLGFFLSRILSRYWGASSYLILFSLFILSFILATDFMVFPVIQRLFIFIKSKARQISVAARQPKVTPLRTAAQRPAVQQEKTESAAFAQRPERKIEYAIHKKEQKEKAEKPKPPKPVPAEPKGDYRLPPLDLLDSPPPIEERKIRDDLKTNSDILESTLADFDIEAKVVRVEQGPVITRYELEPAPGVKINRITALSDNIALVMKAQSVRVVAPIPGKGTVGVEVPNISSSVVYLREVMDSQEFKNASSKLTLGLGKDIAGKPLLAELADMPHLLIAGTTGSGKTVCVNCLIISLLFSLAPEEVKFLMVDPKMVELAVFNGLPHLLCPVVTDAKKAAVSLNWVVNEMERRYRLLAKVGARNIDAYNEKAGSGNGWLDDDGSSLRGRPMEKLPYIIVIIDELADLMVVARDDIENAITRLAQLSRAVGIHIILATQRPSVDVITGVIKANFPARISFKVASKVDSRTVLDMNGADKLLGRGDMLFIEPGGHKPVRAQGSLIADTEIERVVNYIKSQRDAMYDEAILNVQEKKAVGKTFEKDELFDEAVKVVLLTKQASVSMLQRKLGLGYTRAARLIDAMEDDGIIGPYRGSKPREILVEDEASGTKGDRSRLLSTGER